MNDFTPQVSRTLTVTRELRVPIKKAFALFSTPLFFERASAVRDTAKFDFRIGGRYWHEVGEDRDAEHVSGELTDIQPEKRIAFTWNTQSGGKDISTLVIIDFKKNGENATAVTLRHAGFPNDASLKGHQGGWTEILEGMAKEAGR